MKLSLNELYCLVYHQPGLWFTDGDDNPFAGLPPFITGLNFKAYTEPILPELSSGGHAYFQNISVLIGDLQSSGVIVEWVLGYWLSGHGNIWLAFRFHNLQ